ncbi:MAG: DUF202 domain-containing protein [Gammaproteobacteria bacterium]|nr:DUF202 domain-containing protein [Gammaproteobacteria bacterium]
MIRNFSDHAANERTFLAWVRTAIAVMAFGFLVAKFNLFLKIAAQSFAASGIRPRGVPGGGFGNVAGLALIAAGTLIVSVATVRFMRTGRAIDSERQQVNSARADLLLAAMVSILGLALLVYLAETLAVSG